MNLRAIEAASLIRFVVQAAEDGHLKGRVLDFGCGRQPYKSIVEAGASTYVPYDRHDFPGNTSRENIGVVPIGQPGVIFDAVLCTQVIQYIPDVRRTLNDLHTLLRPGGSLVLTYPTNWPEVEPEDLHRFTQSGMERLLRDVGFDILRHERRAVAYMAGGEPFALGYGAIARA